MHMNDIFHRVSSGRLILVSGLVLVGAMLAASTASAVTRTFTGGKFCRSVSLPAGVNVVYVTAQGSAGQDGAARGYADTSGGPGDVVSGKISGLSAAQHQLFVCVNLGGGYGDEAETGGGEGGGASGVALGTRFDVPALIAAGGGGGAWGAAGGAAGYPSGGSGAWGLGAPGGGGTQTAGGMGGYYYGVNGDGTGWWGPGSGGSGGQSPPDGSGGGGGGGYWGGGGGGGDDYSDSGGGGGGGGSDFCGTSLGGHAIVGNCRVTGTNTTYGAAFVKLTYAAPPTVKITTPTPGATFTRGQKVRARFTCAEGAGGPGLRSCLDGAGKLSGSAINTRTVGRHIFSVTAVSRDGQRRTSLVHYTVRART